MLSRLLAQILIALALAGAAFGQTFDTRATAALVVDHETGAVLFARNADAPMPPASMSKLMTLNMLFEAVDEGSVSLADTFVVSERAWRMGGSRMFLEPRHEPTVEDLIRGIIIHSGNDACVVVAENLAGTEEAFADVMTARARELGMMESTFINSTGWPADGHVMSARDLVHLARHLIEDFPDLYPYFAETEYTWDGITQSNRNPILFANIGGDGLKTGHTEEAGYGLVGSAVQDGRRVVFMVTGLEDARARSTESTRIVQWAFREFENITWLEAGAEVAEAPVHVGAAESVPLAVAEDVRITIPRGEADAVTAIARFDSPLPSPVAAGTVVGEMEITIPNLDPVIVPLVAAADVAEGGMMTRFTTAVGQLAGRAMNAAFGGE